MPRPQRCRRICDEPYYSSFGPKDEQCENELIVMTLDEYEVIRLVDLDGLTHEQCAEQMDISRSTVQEIYESARRKLAMCLVHGHKLNIIGGNYRVCAGHEQNCCRYSCPWKYGINEIRENDGIKGDGNMKKIAVTYDNGQIFQHFGHTSQFKIYTIEGDKVVSGEVVDTNGSGHGALAGFLVQQGVDTLICGGIGGGAQAALAEAGIELYGGAIGNADAAVKALLGGHLLYNPNVMCSHHGHSEGTHTCGEHTCGTHTCG